MVCINNDIFYRPLWDMKKMIQKSKLVLYTLLVYANIS